MEDFLTTAKTATIEENTKKDDNSDRAQVHEIKKICRARVAELVDALDLGSSGISCGGSSPPSRTR